MLEARITCTCARIIIDDLGLRLTKGNTVYVTETQAKKSKDLMLAARSGAVDVQYIKRVSEIRQPVTKAVVGKPRREPLPVYQPRIPTIHVVHVPEAPAVSMDVVTTTTVLEHQEDAELLAMAEEAWKDPEPGPQARGRKKKGA